MPLVAGTCSCILNLKSTPNKANMFPNPYINPRRKHCNLNHQKAKKDYNYKIQQIY